MTYNPYWLAAALLFALVIYAPSIQPKLSPRRLGKDPGLFNLKIWLARIDFLRNGQKLVQQSYRRDTNANYTIQTLLGDQVVLGPKYLPELRMLPESSLNATAALVDSVLGSYSGVDILLKGHLSSDICRGQLTKNLPNILPQMIDELNLALSDELVDCQQGNATSYVAYKIIYSLISRVSSRAFIGAPKCYDEAWVEAVNAFPMDVEKVKFALLLFPNFMRSWLVPFLPPKWRLTRNHEKVQKLLFPSSNLEKSAEDFTVLNFLLQTSRDNDPGDLTSRLILLTAAAFHNSSMATVQVVYSLCAMPEWVQILRKEAQTALQEGGKVWSLAKLSKLRRLDSFIKESQRVNGSSFLGFDRKVMSRIELSDGTVILPGSTIAMPSGPMAQDQSYYNDPLTFDGDRFYRVTAKENEGAQQSENDYTGIEPGNLSWGHGRFSCPGRWYASVMMKLLLATIILDYEFKFPEPQSIRPSNTVMDLHVLPDMKQKIMLKKRQGMSS